MRSRGLILIPAAVVAGLVVYGSVEHRPHRPIVPVQVAASEDTRLILPSPTVQAPVTLHYAPRENLEHVDVALIDGATRSIDMAAYVLTDFPVIEALTRAAARGVAIRILLDRMQHEDRPEVPPLAKLRAEPGVAIRIKASNVFMHMKSYAVDGRVLRTGAANFSASGLKHQDNDLVVIESPTAADLFTDDFAVAYAAGVAE